MTRVQTTNAIGTLFAAGLLAGAAAVVFAQTATTGPAVKPAAVAARAQSPPPANATKVKTAGKNKLTVSTANSPTDDDSFWVEKIDIDGNGTVEDANLVWDDEDKVLFAYSATAFTCKNGGTATSDMLVATNAAGNSRNRPAGSGFWVVDVNKGQCGAEAAGLMGCRFDAKGNETACGIVTIDEKNDDIVIVAARK